VPVVIRCPSCDRALRLPDDLVGSKVRCPDCQTAFTAEAPDEAPEPAPAPRPGPVTDRPSRRPKPPPEAAPRDEGDDDYRDPYEDEADDDEPRPRRRGRAKEKARGSVMGPGIALMVVGGLGFLVAVANTAVQFLGDGPVAGPAALGRPAAARTGVDPTAFRVGQIFGATIGFPWCFTVCFGGLQMMRLRSRGWAMAGAIVAMVPCNLCCVLGLPFGIWALVALNKPEVVRAFG
jgi:hypothetical protein